MKSTEDSTQAALATLALELGPGHPQGLRPGAFTPACLSLMAPLCLSSPLSFSSCFSSHVSPQEHHRNYTLLPSGRRDRHFFWTMGPLSPCSLSLSSLLPPDANQGIFPKTIAYLTGVKMPSQPTRVSLCCFLTVSPFLVP